MERFGNMGEILWELDGTYYWECCGNTMGTQWEYDGNIMRTNHGNMGMRFGILWEFYRSSIGILWKCYDWEHHRYIMGLPQDKYGNTLGMRWAYYENAMWYDLSTSCQVCPDITVYTHMVQDCLGMARYVQIVLC